MIYHDIFSDDKISRCRMNCEVQIGFIFLLQVLGELLSTLPIRQLHLFLPQLLSNVFGFDNTPGWRLSSIHSSFHPTDFTAIRNFLKPNGGKELKKCIYKYITL